MAMLALTSASGAPGVTTTAVGLAQVWPRPSLIVDADPTGCSPILAGYLRGITPHDRGLLDIRLAIRRGLPLEESVYRFSLELPGGTARLLPGMAHPRTAPAADGLWQPLAAALRSLEQSGTDVIVDLGRQGLTHSATPLMAEADMVLLLTRTNLPALSAAQAAAEMITETLVASSAVDHPDVLLVGEKQPFTAREAGQGLGVPVLSTLAWDPASAEVFSLGSPPPRRFDRSPLVRSLHATVATVTATVDRRATLLRQGLDSDGTGGIHA